jgi:hypothetical protein
MSVVAALAPARQTGYVQSFESNPASPKIRRPRMEGAPYLMVIRWPAIVAEALAGGAREKQLGDAHQSDEESRYSHQ